MRGRLALYPRMGDIIFKAKRYISGFYMRGPLLCCVLCVGMLRAGFAQDLHYSIRNYTAIDGLPQSQVSKIVEDKNGYLWMGTLGGGLARFDGREFRVYTTMDGLLTNFVTDLVIDHEQNLWILHYQGVTKYDGRNFDRFRIAQSDRAFKMFRSIIEVRDSVYALSSSFSLYQSEGDSLVYAARSVPLKVYRFIVSPAGDFCFYLESGEFLIMNEHEEFTIKPDKDVYFENLFIHDKEIWAQSPAGIARLDLEHRKLVKVPFTIPHYIEHYDTKRDLFWTLQRGTLFKESIQGNRIHCDTVMKDVEVAQVMTDSENNVWVATNGRGVFKYYYKDFDKVTPDDFRGVMSVCVDREGAQWIGTMTKGLWKIKNKKFSYYPIEDPAHRKLMPNGVLDIKEAPDGTLWVASRNGLGKYNRRQDAFTWYRMEDGLTSNNVLNLSFDERGNVWAGTGRGLNYFNGVSFTKYGEEQGFRSILANTYLKKFGLLYTGDDFGLNTVDREGKVNRITLPELENTMILSLNPYQDSLLLIGSGGAGIAIYNPVGKNMKLLTSREGLTSDFIYFVAEDSDHTIWVGMEKGISRIRLNDKLEIVENLHYDYDNGLHGVETNQNAFFLGNGHKYFGLIDGLYVFNDLSSDGKKSFDLHMTNVEIFYGEYSASEYADSLVGFFKIPKNPVLPPDRNHITFHFNRVDKRYPKSVKFRYFLQNFDKTWSQPSSLTQVTYGNLPPGNYSFRVMATNSEGSWTDEKILYNFTVQTPFYQTASFIAGVIIFVAGSITFLMYMRVRQRVKKMIDTERIRMRELESLRKEIARDFHDEMGNQLTRIINYISLMKLNGHATNGGSDKMALYAKVEESAKYLYTGTRDFIWSIDPVNDELSKLFIHIRDFGEKLFEEKNIHFRAYDEVKEKIKLPNGFSREANLIFKEAMTNAFKYSEAENVRLALARVNDHFEMMFEDDGVGFGAVQADGANGLRNIHERAKRIGAVLHVNSTKHTGTKIILDFKLNKTVKHGHAF